MNIEDSTPTESFSSTNELSVGTIDSAVEQSNFSLEIDVTVKVQL